MKPEIEVDQMDVDALAALGLIEHNAVRELRAQLAAAQATIAQMREDFNTIATARVGALSQREMATAALTASSNQDALHEALARECERLADTVLAAVKVNGAQAQYDIEASDWLREEAAAHRARKETK